VSLAYSSTVRLEADLRRIIFMAEQPTLRRRDVLRGVTTATVAMAAAAAPLAPVVARAESRTDKRKPQYQPNSAEVRAFYRVNRYPSK
jgi:hypothetical protein